MSAKLSCHTVLFNAELQRIEQHQHESALHDAQKWFQLGGQRGCGY